jgi:hypothetical protein
MCLLAYVGRLNENLKPKVSREQEIPKPLLRSPRSASVKQVPYLHLSAHHQARPMARRNATRGTKPPTRSADVGEHDSQVLRH